MIPFYPFPAATIGALLGPVAALATIAVLGVFAVLVVGLVSESHAQRTLAGLAPLPLAGSATPATDETPARLSA